MTVPPDGPPSGPLPPARPGPPAATPAAGDDPEERDAGLALERTTLAWRRTALSFAAVGGVVLKVNVITGLLILAVAPVVWQLGRVSRGQDAPGLPVIGATRLFAITLSIVAVALLSGLIVIFGHSVPGALR